MHKEIKYYNELSNHVNCTKTPTKNRQSEILDPDKDCISVFPEVPTHNFIMERCPRRRSEEEPSDDTGSESPAGASPSSVLAPVDSEIFQTSGNDTDALAPLRLPTQSEFRIEALKHYLESCVNRGKIDLNSYLDSYQEICKLLETFGTVIRNVIGRDIRNKIALLRRCKAGRNGSFYQTLDSMVTYERVTRQYQRSSDENGSKIALNLHRSLNFVAEFLRKINESDLDHGLGTVAKDVYNETLAEFHPSHYKYFARLAFSSLGSKEQLVANFHDGSMSDVQLEEVINDTVKAATQVYSCCHAVFERHNFLG